MPTGKRDDLLKLLKRVHQKQDRLNRQLDELRIEEQNLEDEWDRLPREYSRKLLNVSVITEDKIDNHVNIERDVESDDPFLMDSRIIGVSKGHLPGYITLILADMMFVQIQGRVVWWRDGL